MYFYPYLFITVCVHDVFERRVCTHATEHTWRSEDNLVGLVLLSLCGFQGLDLGHWLTWSAPLSVELSYWPYPVLLKSEHFPRVLGDIANNYSVVLLLNLEVTAYASNQVLPPVLNKPIKGAKLKVKSRKKRFIQCGHIEK